ncbi:TaqI-like C-terminal specificity domain-containing protein, partial [Thermodesulfobacteriota bacterium]
DSLNGSYWDFSDKSTRILLQKMKRNGIPLKDYVNGQILAGIKTGRNKAFWIDSETKTKLTNGIQGSSDLIKKLIVGDNVRKWHIRNSGKWLLYMFHGIDTRGLSEVLTHLKKFKSELEGRAAKQKWYELQQPQLRYTQAFESPKIIFPDIAKEPRFAFDDSGAYIDMTAFAIPIRDLYLLGILNSGLVWEYLVETAAVLGDAHKGGRLRLKRQYVENIPIPKASSVNREAIETLVLKCLRAKGQNCDEWEKEIEKRIAPLYGV